MFYKTKIRVLHKTIRATRIHSWSTYKSINGGQNSADLRRKKRNWGENRRAYTSCSRALEEDLFGGDHGEAARASVVPLDGVAELGPRAALNGAPGEARAREAAGAGGGDDLDLVALAVEAVLDHRPEAARVGPEDDPRREA